MDALPLVLSGGWAAGVSARSSPLAFPDQAGFAGARGTGGDVTLWPAA
jgi:hypothetical protein